MTQSTPTFDSFQETKENWGLAKQSLSQEVVQRIEPIVNDLIWRVNTYAQGSDPETMQGDQN